MADIEQDIMQLPPELPVGEDVTMAHAMFVYLADNSTMIPAGDMDGMNTNLPREKVVKSLAASFAKSVDDTSTLCVLAATSPDHGTPTTFLDATLRAITATRADNPQLDAQTTAAFQNMSADIRDVEKKTCTPTWIDSFQAAMWKADFKPPADFHDKRPAFITLQGQHRLAVFLLALGPSLGLERGRAGRLQTVEPFEGEGAEAQMKALSEGLASTKSRLRVLVHGHISHEIASKIGHSTHKHESATNRPQLLDTAAFFTPLIKQIVSPAEPICVRRAEEFFGDGWDDYFVDLHRGGEKPAAPQGFQGRAMARSAIAEKKDFIEATQKKLMESVLEGLTLIGAESKKNKSHIYAVYAMALQPESAFVLGITEHLQRARNGEIKDHASTAVLDLEVLAAILRLSANSQKKMAVWSAVDTFGITHSLRKPIDDFSKVEIFEQLVASLALRVHVNDLSDPSSLNKDVHSVFDHGVSHGVEVPLSKGKGKPNSTGAGVSNDASVLSGADAAIKCESDVFPFFEHVLGAFTEYDAEFFSSNEHKRLDDVVLMAEKWIPALVSFVGKGFRPVDINRKVLQKGLGRIEQRFPALKNKSSVVTGADSKTGEPRPPFVSTSGTVVPISKQVLQEYVLDSGAKGHDGRVMYLCFAVLVVDRALSQGRAGGEGVPQRFKDLWEAMPTSTKPLKDALLSSAEDLVLRDANGEKVEAFFDASRLAFFDLQKNAEAESGGGKDGSESGLVVATCEQGEVHFSLTTSVMKDLGLMTEAGTFTNHIVDVRAAGHTGDVFEEECMGDDQDTARPAKRSRYSARTLGNEQNSRSASTVTDNDRQKKAKKVKKKSKKKKVRTSEEAKKKSKKKKASMSEAKKSVSGGEDTT